MPSQGLHSVETCSFSTLVPVQDLESCAEEALDAFAHAQQLLLSEVSLDAEYVLEVTATAPQLLQGLKSLQVRTFQALSCLM